MKKLHKHSIDELFSDNLGDFSTDPPEIVWSKLSVKLPVSQHIPAKRYRLIHYSTAASVAILISVFSYAWYSGVFSRHNKPLSARGVQFNNYPENKLENAPLLVPEYDDIIPVVLRQSTIISRNSDEKNVAYRKSTPDEPYQGKQVEISDETLLQKENLSRMNSPVSRDFSMAEYRVLPDFSFRKSNDYYSYPYFYLGSASGMEILQSDNEKLFKSGKSNAFLSLNGGIQFPNFYVETGLQLNKITGTFDGTKNTDLVYHNGETTNIDSVGYAIVFDSLGQPYYIPVYFTSTHPDYDTMMVQAPAQIKKDMTYLEIPFSIGVSQTFRRHYIAASMGMSYSFKLKDHSPGSINDERLLINEIPGFWSLRVNMNYQYMISNHWNAGVRIQYRYFSKTGTNTNQFLNSSYSLGISPTITYIF